jgi:hypothetical protein
MCEFCRWWEGWRKYFPLSLKQEVQFDASKRYLFVVHPHGVIGFSAWLTFVRLERRRLRYEDFERNKCVALSDMQAADTVGFSRKNHNLDIAMATVICTRAVE